MTPARLSCLLAALLCGTAPARAELTEQDFLGELPVVLSATRMAQPVAEAPTSITLIDRAMIEASGFRDIPELLRLVPGFVVAYTRDNSWTAGYHGLADAYSRRFQVLVDGRSIYSSHYGAVNWTDLPLAIEDIERIEVVRGPNAAIDGSNAFVAVINIITRTAAQASGKYVRVDVGEAAMRGVVARVGGGGGDLHYRVTVSSQHRDRFARTVDYKPLSTEDNGEYFEATQTGFVNGRVDWQLSPRNDFMAQFGLSSGDWRAGRDVINPTDVFEPRSQTSMAGYLQLAWHGVGTDGREWRLQGYHSVNRFGAESSLGPVSIDDGVDQARSNVSLEVNEQWRSDLRGVWGAEVRNESARSPGNYGTDKTYSGTLARAFGHVEWRATPVWLVQAGAMAEHHYLAGDTLSPRVSVNYMLTPGHTLRVGVSRAYRSPTFYEQYVQRASRNPDGSVKSLYVPASGMLEPERILSRDIGYTAAWPRRRLEFDVRLFQDHIEDFLGLQRIANPPKVFQYQNLGTVDQQGGEIELRWRPGPFDLSAHFARTFLAAATSYINANKDIPQSAPRNSGGVLAGVRLDGGWQASVGWWRSAAVKWLTEGDLVEPFSRVDVRLARSWNWRGSTVEASLTGQSVAGDYYEFRDTNRFTPRVFAGLAVSLP